MKISPFILLVVLFCFPSLQIAGQIGEVEQIQKQYRNDILRLVDHQKIQQAYQWILDYDEQSVKDLIFLTEIPAPPFKEKTRAKALVKMFIEAGADSVWMDEVDNVLVLRKGTKGGKTVALDAHTDTVFPEGTDVSVKVKGDTLYAPGIGDDTRGVAMILAVFKAMNEAQIQTETDILFIGSVGEEGLGDLRGVKHLFRKDGPGIDSWISIDGGEIGRVNNKGLGSVRYKVVFHGPGGHSWGAFGLANPHHALGSAIHHFTREADTFTSYGERTSYNVGVITGGTSVNSVPFESIMQVDMRSVSPARLDSIENILHQAVTRALHEQNKIARIGDTLTVEMIKIGDRPSGELSATLPLIQRAMAATASFGKAPRLTRGSTNSNIPISMGIPAVTIGRGGRAQNAHSLNEWWLNDNGYQATQLALLLLIAESGLASD
jgi:acetylornithine deacetylase/succinyl-diaminopimelate desuccinylase-like protein